MWKQNFFELQTGTSCKSQIYISRSNLTAETREEVVRLEVSEMKCLYIVIGWN